LKFSKTYFFSENNSKFDKILKFAKIGIIVFVSIYLIGNFIPYFEASDAYTFASVTLNWADGSYVMSNKLLEETDRWEFVPFHWTKTVFDSYVPTNIGVGFTLIVSPFFAIFGYPSLFYLGPIFTIVFLIISERISTKLFGNYVGFFTLLLLASNIWILDTGLHFMSDMLFASFTLVGIFYLIRFFYKGNSNLILYSSIFLASSSLIRINGAIFFPIEILLVVGYLLVQKIKLRNNFIHSNNEVRISNIVTFTKKKTVKISLFVLIPWIIFFGFWFSYNDYYFGDPLTYSVNVRKQIPNGLDQEDFTTNSFFTISKDHFDLIKGYMRALLPSPLSTNLYDIPNNYDHIFGKYWLGLFSIGFLISVLLFSCFSKNKRIEVFLFSLFIFGVLWFYTSSPSSGERLLEISGSRRYMLSTFPLFFMLLGFSSQKILEYLSKKIHLEKTNFRPKIFRNIFFGFLISFFVLAFYFSSPIQAISNNEFIFQDPSKLMERYPIDLEGLSKNDIILDLHALKTVEYGLIPFNGLLDGEGPEEFDSKPSIQKSIGLLKETMDKGYDVYIFKEPSRGVDRDFFKYLAYNHGFIIKDHSKSFCKLILQSDDENFVNKGQENQAIDAPCISAPVKYYK